MDPERALEANTIAVFFQKGERTPAARKRVHCTAANDSMEAKEAAVQAATHQ